jgi:hypothetical protein
MTAAPHDRDPDRPRVRLEDPAERRYWTARLGVGEDELRAIVERIGDEAGAVEDYVLGASSAH